MIGRTVSHYRIVSQLGVGGMGVVYRAEDVRLGRPVAVKFVSEDLGSDEQAIQRLRAEARAASALNHGNICTIYDIGEDEGKPFIVMELMKGESLRERLARGPLKIHQLVDMGIEIADALHASHTDGIIHRDIKPGNIFLTEGGHVKLLDFGLAKLTPNFAGSKTIGATRESTVAGITLGTISYMSPEQATGDELDGRTDLFSLGVVMYECATGNHPFPGKTAAVTLAGILHKAPIAPVTLNPELPLRLQEVLNNCLEKDRELRYQSAADLRADLKRVRRDMESGNTRTIDVVSSRGLAHAEDSSAPRTVATTAQDTPPTTATAPPVATTAGVGRKWLMGGAAVVAVAAIGLFAVWGNRGAPTAPTATPISAPTPTQVSSVPDGIVQSRLALANASLQARNYRAALAYAAEVLGVEATNADAAKIRDEAQTMLARFDAAIVDARRRLSTGDVVAAARALETARGIDPTAPVIIELSSGLNEALRKADAGARAAAAREVREARQALPPPPPPPAPVQRSAPDSSAAARAEVAPSVGSAPIQIVPPPVVPAPKPVDSAPPPAQKLEVPDTPVQRTAPIAPSPPVATSGADDEAAIRRLAATYARAIEGKDLSLFRSIKPNLTRDEERRLQDGFRAVTSQRVNLTIVSIDRRGDEAAVVVRRRDTIEAGGRQQTNETQQTMRVARSNGSWVIVDIR